MTFPPEVASFMALADTKEQSQPPGNLAPQNPEGSHSSSPGDSQRASPIMEQEEIVQGDSPRPSQDTVTSRPSTSPVGAPDSRPSIESTTLVSPVSPPQPDHTQLTPALLPHARLSIPHSTVFPNQSGRDVLCFIVAVTVRPPNSTTPLSWTVGKTFSAFMELDTRAQERSGKGRKEWKRMVSPLPEGKAWKDFAPSKIDQRKAALEAYLQSLLVAPVSDKSDLCTFLSTDVVQAKTNKLRKEGYLTKKGKNFGGWKTRYFVLEGPVMKYYESRGGAFLGSIQIVGAQIGRQNRSPDASDDRNFRHAFLIIEANGKKDSSQNRHVLCASSDLERDSWIDMLVRQVDPDLTPPTPAPQNGPPNPMSAGLGHQRRRSAIRKGSKDVIVTSAQPMSQLPDANAKFISGAPLPSVINLMESQRLQHAPSNSSISSQAQQSGTSQPAAAPPTVHLTPASVASTTDLLLPSEPTPKPLKRQSAMPVRQSFSPAYLTKLSSDGVSSVPGYNTDRERDRKAKSGRFWGFGKTPEKGTARPVFGVPLADSISIASVAGLPAIVFRCIEYLEAKHADQEEGIYRLSGSSAVIKGLKERFNQEGDVNLLQIDERWDPHAIAGLLKTYLRELPTSLLTRTLHMRFLAVIGENDRAQTTYANARPGRLHCPRYRAVSLGCRVAAGKLHPPEGVYGTLNSYRQELGRQQDDITQHWHRVQSDTGNPRGHLLRTGLPLWCHLRRRGRGRAAVGRGNSDCAGGIRVARRHEHQPRRPFGPEEQAQLGAVPRVRRGNDARFRRTGIRPVGRGLAVRAESRRSRERAYERSEQR